MKKILYILCFFFSITSYAQVNIGSDGKVHSSSGGGTVTNSNELTAVSDTTIRKTGFAIIGTQMYVGNGSYWVATGLTSVDWSIITSKPSNFSTTHALSNDIIDSLLSKVALRDSITKYITPTYLSTYYYNKTQSDARFQPLENQRLSTTYSPTFAGLTISGITQFGNNIIYFGSGGHIQQELTNHIRISAGSDNYVNFYGNSQWQTINAGNIYSQSGAFYGNGAGLTGTASGLSIGGNAATASSFSGDGSAITGLNANNISTGTLSNSRLNRSVTFDTDTIPLASFSAGSGASTDTAAFQTTSIYGSFYNSGSDTLVITSFQVGLQGSSPSVVVKIYYNDSLAVTAGATALVNAGNTCTNIYTGTTVSSLDNAKIPPGNFVWLQTPTLTTKPTFLSLTLLGYKKKVY